MLVALLIPLLAGLGMLGVDAGQWYYHKRNLQTAADAAAIAGALHLARNESGTLEDAAQRDAERNGFDAVAGSIDVQNPPLSDPGSGDNAAVAVELTEPLKIFYAGLFATEGATVSASATATTVTEDTFCVLGLDPTMAGAVEVQGTADMTLSCGVAVNSSSGEALSLNGNADLTATEINVVGDIGTSGNPSVTATNGVKTGRSSVTDPYADLDVPSFSGCDANNLSINSTTTLSPGVYCNGLTVKANKTLTLQPGTYIIDRGEFKVNGGATVSGDDVTIILTSSTGSNHATMTINGGATVEVAAPSSGDYAGIAFFQDRNAASFQGNNLISNKFTGGATLSILGAVYFPSQSIEFSGNANLGPGCVQLIGRQVSFTGTSELSIDCSTVGTKPIGTPKIQLLH